MNKHFRDRRHYDKNVPIEETHNLFYNEIMIRNFNCAFLGKIFLQGKVYVSNEAIYFYSLFNDKSLIKRGKATKFRLPYENMIDIQKAKNAKIFDNSIRIILSENKRVFLTSFINRNNCYNLMIAFKK